MKKYLAIYNSPAEAMKNMAAATPEQKAEGMKPWMEWQAQGGATDKPKRFQFIQFH